LAFTVAFLVAAALAFADVDIYVNGSYEGRIEDDGDVYIDGSYKGRLEEDGDVYVNGSYAGRLEDDGDIYVDGSYFGRASGMVFCCPSPVAAYLIFFGGYL